MPSYHQDQGCFNLLITCKYCDTTCKYCGNTHKYWANAWKMCSPASSFASIVTILACGLWKLTFTVVDSYRKPLQKCFKTYKYCGNTLEYYNCRWTHFSSIGSILVSITTTNKYCRNTCEYWAGEYTPSNRSFICQI